MLDLPTRICLWIIAVSLAILASVQVVRLVQPSDAVAKAKRSRPQKVVICDLSGDFCARVEEDSRLLVK